MPLFCKASTKFHNVWKPPIYILIPVREYDFATILVRYSEPMVTATMLDEGMTNIIWPSDPIPAIADWPSGEAGIGKDMDSNSGHDILWSFKVHVK